MRLSIQYLTAVGLLVTLLVFLQDSSRVEDSPARPGFIAFPLELKDREHGGTLWIGREVGLEPEIRSVLKVDDYMMRVYLPMRQEGRFTPHVPVWLYVGYYQTQRTGATYHSPLNCLPGSGWSILSREVVPVGVAEHGAEVRSGLHVNKVLIQKGLETQLILYWYQDRGRSITDEYWAKAYLLLDAMMRNRTDGALVRISVPLASSSGGGLGVEEAFGIANQFLQDAYPRLMAHLPV